MRICGEVQFDSRFGGCRLQHLDTGRHVHRLDISEFANAVLLDPGKEVTRRPVIGRAGVLVADRHGEKLDEAACGVLAGIGDHRGDH
jgi:hypothetical protein